MVDNKTQMVYNIDMNIKELILKLAQEKKAIQTADIIKAHQDKISRQYVNRVVRDLIAEGKLVKVGKTRKTFYSLPEFTSIAAKARGNAFRRRLRNKNLKEHEILTEISNSLDFLKNAAENVKSILDYAFSEMLNNAIEHSESEYIEIEVLKRENTLEFIVDDYGIGVFRNVMKKRQLASELEAIQDLLKGKTTTQPKAHSGEGIFFTSKVADVFSLDSYEYRMRIDNTLPDVFVLPLSETKKGTRVHFSIDIKTKKHLIDIFAAFETDPEERGFDKTEIQVRLYTMGTIYVSRSQARRILSGLEKFKSITLDYERVPTIGQAFADEIYRVFLQQHPGISITSINTSEAVQFMINRVEKPKTLF